MTPTTAAPPLLTAEEFMDRYDDDRHAELAAGVVEWEVPVPGYRHGEVCSEFTRRLSNFVKDNRLGRVFSNDTFIRLRRDPDTVRGPDVCFFDFATMPPGPVPDRLTDLLPRLAVEVKSPSNTWAKIDTKVAEYLAAGIPVAVVLDPDAESATVYRAGELPQTRHNGDELTLPDVLPGFAVPVRAFFE